MHINNRRQVCVRANKTSPVEKAWCGLFKVERGSRWINIKWLLPILCNKVLCSYYVRYLLPNSIKCNNCWTMNNQHRWNDFIASNLDIKYFQFAFNIFSTFKIFWAKASHYCCLASKLCNDWRHHKWTSIAFSCLFKIKRLINSLLPLDLKQFSAWRQWISQLSLPRKSEIFWHQC